MLSQIMFNLYDHYLVFCIHLHRDYVNLCYVSEIMKNICIMKEIYIFLLQRSDVEDSVYILGYVAFKLI